MKRVLALLLTLCLLPLSALGSEWDLDWDDEEEITLEDLEELPLEDEEGIGDLTITDSVEDLLAEMDSWEVDTSVNPDDLELNSSLPDNVINILLIGIDSHDRDIREDKASHLNDVNMVLSLDTDTGEIKLTSILRDLYVEIPGFRGKAKLNNAFTRGSAGGDLNGGAQLTMRTINHNFELNIENYVVINFYGVAAIIDSLGGVDIDLTKAEARGINNYLNKTAYTSSKFTYDTRDRTEREDLAVEAGVQHCDGIQALMYARLRKIDNDFARTARQRHLMELLLRQVVSSIDINKLMDLMQTCLPYVLTNMNASTIMNLALTVLGSGIMEKISSGGSLLEQHRVPMDGMYGYLTLDSGASVVNLGEKNWRLNKESIHYFIYGQTYLAQ